MFIISCNISVLISPYLLFERLEISLNIIYRVEFLFILEPEIFVD